MLSCVMNRKNGPTRGMVIILSKSTRRSEPSWAAIWMAVVRGMRCDEARSEATN